MRSKKEQNVINDEVSGYATGSNPGNDAQQPDHSEGMITLRDITETETRTEDTVYILILSVEGEAVHVDTFVLKGLLQGKRKGNVSLTESEREHPSLELRPKKSKDSCS